MFEKLEDVEKRYEELNKKLVIQKLLLDKMSGNS